MAAFPLMIMRINGCCVFLTSMSKNICCCYSKE